MGSLLTRCKPGRVRRYDSTTVRQYDSTTVRQYDSTTARQCDSGKAGRRTRTESQKESAKISEDQRLTNQELKGNVPADLRGLSDLLMYKLFSK